MPAGADSGLRSIPPESTEGALLYIDDTAIAAVDVDGPIQGIVVPVIAV